MNKSKKIVAVEYQFAIGPVIFDVIAQSKAEAVKIANDSLYHFDDPINAPGNFERVQINIGRRFTAKDIVNETKINEI